MYPLLLKPCVKDYIWGGKRLKEEFGIETDKERAAEAWMLSCSENGDCRVLNGEFGGMCLSEVLEIWGDTALGKRAERFDYFPVLIKLIDANDRLSVQVHPNDEQAKLLEGASGKCEMWYVVDCEDGASLIYGLKKDVSKAELEKRINEGTLLEICNTVPVVRGDVFFIPAGTIHGIGGGILIAEVQQNSNITYRVYDYGRLGKDGLPRELHINKACAVINRCAIKPRKHNYAEVAGKFGSIRKLVECDYFICDIISLSGKLDIYFSDSFSSLIILDGKIKISFGGEELSAKKGNSIFIPADLGVEIFGKAKILLSRI